MCADLLHLPTVHMTFTFVTLTDISNIFSVDVISISAVGHKGRTPLSENVSHFLINTNLLSFYRILLRVLAKTRRESQHKFWHVSNLFKP